MNPIATADNTTAETPLGMTLMLPRVLWLYKGLGVRRFGHAQRMSGGIDATLLLVCEAEDLVVSMARAGGELRETAHLRVTALRSQRCPV
ncbi:MAG TPA: hypothetical protein VMJ65_14580 [Solirubrobacteraceae bacterium]|nr:hypothetical protein [Solirubrobacteraceae bacterium]